MEFFYVFVVVEVKIFFVVFYFLVWIGSYFYVVNWVSLVFFCG